VREIEWHYLLTFDYLTIYVYLRFDLIILCSLFKDLNDEEILDIIDVAIKHLNVSGSLLFREAFFTLTSNE